MTRSLGTALAAVLLPFLAALPVSAAQTPRAAHTATLLPTGDVLIAGGINTAGASLATAEILRSRNGGGYVDTFNNMSVQRASATATIMSNGCVLVAGGRTNGGTYHATADVYDPATNSFVATGLAMASAHANHTATLLNNGKVLICGGESASGTISSNCELFTPTGFTSGTGGNVCSGSFAAGPSLLAGRAFHIAVLLRDGKVWFAGGRNASTFLPTTERYDPDLNAFASAAPLIEARAYHTATMMSDGRILVAGGYNGRDVVANRGMLDTMEIYDPVANSIVTAPQMAGRRQMHTSTLLADGSVMIYGGIGNITTSFPVIPALELVAGSTFNALAYTGTSLHGNSSATAAGAGGYLAFDVEIPLTKQVVGTIREGEIWFSSPTTITYESGIAYMTPTDPESTAGFRADLSGTEIMCIGPNCGRIVKRVTVPSAQVLGKAHFNRRGVSFTNVAPTAGTQMTIIGGPFTDLTGPRPINPVSSINGLSLSIGGLPPELIGATISSATFIALGGRFTQPSSWTFQVSSGNVVIPAGTAIVDDGQGAGEMNFTSNLVGINGQITCPDGGCVAGTSTNNSCGAGQPNCVPLPLAGFAPIADGSLDGVLDFVVNRVDLNGALFSIDKATVVIRSMLFGQAEFYNPRANSVGFVSPSGFALATTAADQAFGHTATLLDNNDTFIAGGLDCVMSNARCASAASKSVGGAGVTRDDLSFLSLQRNFSTLSGVNTQRRAFHTSTLLTDGTILVAGGTNGPSILQSAETFNPGTGQVTPASPMKDVRDLHTATLLPNGRVLMAGGFSTSATSTGSIAASEIYYPDTRKFVATSPMATPRSNHSANVLPDGNVFVFGGFGANDVITNTAEVYYSTESRWRTVAPAPEPRTLHTATMLQDGRVLVIGGLNAGGVLNTVRAYDYASNSWDSGLTPMPNVGLRSHSATLLMDGRVLVVGGNDGFGEVNSSLIFDPKGAGGAGTWAETDPVSRNPLQAPRFGHTSILLPNNTVMMTGGATKFGVVPPEHEVFHVNASSWVSGGLRFQASPRAYHTLTLAGNGRVYAIGGSDGVIGGNGTTILNTIEHAHFTFDPDAFSADLSSVSRQARIETNSPTPFLPNTQLTVGGLRFRGGTEASGGGSGAAHSSFSFPHLILQQINGSNGSASQGNSGYVIDLTTEIYVNTANQATLNSTVTVQLPATTQRMPVGWYHARVGANDVYSDGRLLQVGPTVPNSTTTFNAPLTLGISSVQWSWSALAGVDGYNIYQATSGVFLGTAPAIGSPSFVQTGMAPNTTAQVIVAGYNISGDGPRKTSPFTFTRSTTPADVRISSVGFSTLLLQWFPNGNLSNTVYEVSMSTDFPNPFSASTSTPVPTNFFLTNPFTTITDLQANTTYSFRVRAFDANGLASPFSAIVSTLTRSNVFGLVGTALPTGTQIQWGWFDPGGITKFRVYNSTSGELIGETTSSFFIDGNLGVNSRRSVMVAAVTAAGEGPLSDSATNFTAARVPLPLSPVLVDLSTGSFSVRWDSNLNPLGTPYAMRVAEVIGTTITVSTINVTTTKAGIGSLKPSTRYDTLVNAFNGDAFPSQDMVVGTTYTMPAQPLGPSVLGTTPISISIDWNENSNGEEAVYQVTYGTDQFFSLPWSTAVPFSQQFTGSSATITGLLTSTTYFIRVQSRNPLGQVSQFSGIASTITFNGGAPPGSLAGVMSRDGNSQVEGNIAGGRAVQLRSPGGAWPSDVTVTISSQSMSGANSVCPNGIDIGVRIVVSPALQPTRAVAFTASYLPAEVSGINLSRAALMRYEPTSGTCVPLETMWDTNARTFTARLNHFSVFQVAAVPVATTVSNARVFPNPFRAARDGYVTIDQIPPTSRVRILTLRGESVADLTANSQGMVTWNATNGSGRPVASGLYLILLESGGGRKMLKLAVVR